MGQYSLYIFGNPNLPKPEYACYDGFVSGEPGSRAIIVALVNGFCINGGCDATWGGFWNETVVIWAPQKVDFYLPTNFKGPYTPQVLEFSNAPAGYSYLGVSSSISVTNTEWLNASYSQSANVLGLGGSFSLTYSTHSSNTYTTTRRYGQSGGSLEILERFWTSGTVEYNAISRSWSAPQESACNLPCGGEQGLEQGAQYISTWLYPGSSAPGMYALTDWDYMNLSEGAQDPGSITVAGAMTNSSSYSVTFGQNASLEGVIAASQTITVQWSESTTQTYSNMVNWTVEVPNGQPPACFVVYGQGGSPSLDEPTIIGIYEYSPVKGGCIY
ncbi:MAG TPA: hypothetical protein VEH57_06700 [Thermoplasmata archaeon]|nr:hypothetical protein [Thermoplasmata archaeon]